MLRRRRCHNLTAVHEANYTKLERIVPHMNALDSDIRYRSKTTTQHIEIQILEKTAYTTAFSLTLVQPHMRHWLPEIVMKIRTYHDAKVAEVFNFQKHSRFKPKYQYPNPHMFHTDEKQQINRFFSEWLDHCLNSQIVFDDEIDALSA
ncbi:DUF1249 domain-containing protein [Kaarinaea lacus]